MVDFPGAGKGCTFADDSVDCVSAGHGAGWVSTGTTRSNPSLPRSDRNMPDAGWRATWLVAPEVCFDRPPGSSIRVKESDICTPQPPGQLMQAHSDAGVDDQPQLSRRHGIIARMLRDRVNEQVVLQPPEPAQRSRDKSLHGHPITPRNGLTSPRPQLAWLAQTGQDAKGRQVMVRSSTRSKRRILLCDMPAGPRNRSVPE